MKKEISAGGIVAYKSRKGWLLLLMKDMKTNWTFPKGKREKGEENLEAAVREIAEEVGVTNLTLVCALTPVTYWYNREGSIKKEVHYYLFVTNVQQEPIIQREEGITDARWVKLSEAKKMIGYPKSNVPILEEVRQKLWK